MPDVDLREEFNRWADAGRGERMARGHRPATVQGLDRLEIGPADRCLDVGCGIGWAVRLMADRCPSGEAVGVDVSDAMIARARAVEGPPANVRFEVASGASLPFADASFDRALSVEALYYTDDPAGVLKEIARVLRPCGRLAVLVDFYMENVESHRWADEIAVPMHLLAASDYSRLFEDAGFVAVRTERLLDPSPLPPRESFEPTWGFETWEQLARYRAEGTLLVLGERP
jgi:ubiquinone/menaquinone biosynthesis C-methylase UbiE